MSPLDHDALAAMLDRLDTTGCVVTTVFEGRIDGCFISFITACSMDPPRLLVLTSHENLTHELIERGGVLAVHPLARGQEAWVDHFGRETGRDVDKFATVPWHAGVTGAPILEDALGYIEGWVIASMDCGDHTARLVEPVAAVLSDAAAMPLTTFDLFARGIVQPHPSPAAPWAAYGGSGQ